MAWKHRKLLPNVGNVLQALLGDTTGAEDLQEAVGVEARAILRAAAVPIVGEEEALNGEITLIARRLGRAAPINTRLTALARRAARDGLTPGSIDVDQLRARVLTS